MAISVQIPTPMRQHTGGKAQVDASGSTVQGVLDDLGRQFPGITERLFDTGQLRRFVNVFLGAGILMAFASLFDTAGGAGVSAADRKSMTLMAWVVGGWGVLIVAFGVAATLSLAVRQRAGEMALLNVPAFVFHEGSNPLAGRAFKEIARLSRGAYCPFNSGSAQQLKELLGAVAVFAAGGRKALADYTRKTGGATLLLRFEKGVVGAAHSHPGGEELFVVSGDITVGDERLGAGDYLWTPPGGVHEALAHEPTILLLSTSDTDLISARSSGKNYRWANPSRLTVADLLSHRSGLPRHDLAWLGHPDLTRGEIVSRLRFLPLSRDLRQEFQYCNVGYLVAGHVVEVLSGTPWEEYLRSRLLAPLGMSRSNLSVDEMTADPDHARPYERRHGVQRDQIRGKTDFDIHPHAVAEALRANDRQVIESGVPIEFEEALPSNGGERWFISAKFLLRDQATSL